MEFLFEEGLKKLEILENEPFILFILDCLDSIIQQPRKSRIVVVYLGRVEE